MYKQIIIVRKDLNMTPGMLATQVFHASMIFMINMIKKHAELYVKENKHPAFKTIISNGKCKITPINYQRKDLSNWAKEYFEKGEKFFYTKPVDPANPHEKLELCEPTYYYSATLNFEKELYEQWIDGEYIQCIFQAKNKYQLLRVVDMAKELGMKEDEDYYLIYDKGNEELTQEDDNKILTCIVFRPMDSDVIDKIGRKYQLYV